MSAVVSSTVVVADACPWSRRRVREILNAAGHRIVLEAADGAQAVSLLGGTMPSLLVIDWSLPVIGAVELAQLARGAAQDREGGDLPILLTMTDPKAHAVRSAMEAGITAIVAKPFSARSLRRRLLDAGNPPPA